MSDKDPLLVCVVGPTAIGKTRLSLKIAESFSAEIISADSRQFFKEMSIGTAVPSAKELTIVPHHFIQSRSIFDDYDVGHFEKEAIAVLDKLFVKHKIIVMVGGSGLYVDAVTKGLDKFPEVPSGIRETLSKQYKSNGIESLQKELEKVDPDYFSKVDIHNHHRLIRALEIYRGTGKPFSSFLNNTSEDRHFNTLFIGLTADREIIYDRINRRVDLMLEAGLVKEARNLIEYKDLNALQTVGYRELFRYFEGDLTMEEAISEIKKNSRRFAKRQTTWFKKNKAIHWFNFNTDHSEIIRLIKTKNAQ